jgi:HPt (histidine-containing phosphotransfer) domain-containing protein
VAGAVVAGFLQDFPVQLHHLTERLQAGDAEGARRQAHTLKGAASTISAGALRAAALEAEEAARAGQLEGIGQVLLRLGEAFEQLKAALRISGWEQSAKERITSL